VVTRLVTGSVTPKLRRKGRTTAAFSACNLKKIRKSIKPAECPVCRKREFSCPVTGVRLQGYGDLSMKEIPIWEKSNLSLEEAAAYSGIGINKLREITNEDKCKFVLWVGNKRLIKRRLFDCYIEQAYSI
jgi:hypothetical protein